VLLGAALALACALLGVLGLLVVGSGQTPRAAAQGAAQELLPDTDLAVPAEKVVMLGATPEEPGAPKGETWGLGELVEGNEAISKLVRWVPPSEAGGVVEAGGWEPGPELPAGFQPDHPELENRHQPSPLEGQMTPEGYGVLAGTITSEHTTKQVLLVRKPGEGFVATAPVPSEGGGEGAEGGGGAGEEPPPTLQKGQALFGAKRAPMIAPLREGDGSAGALVVPVYEGEGVDEAVLHWDGHSWTREKIEIPTESAKEFNVLAVAASSPEHAWLLARLSQEHHGSERLALFQRVHTEGGQWSWKPVEVEVGAGSGEVKPTLSVPVAGRSPTAGEPLGVPNAEGAEITTESQLLTVTSEGVWVDGVRTDAAHGQPYTTMYVRPEAAEGVTKGVIEKSWCIAAAETPACEGTLPQEPSLEYGRSIAWPGSAPYGERVITGLSEGVTLRLEGGEFEPVLSIGGGSDKLPEAVPGRLYGAAFSSPGEGWLGYSVPVRLTASPEPDRLGYWPVATRHALLAVAPEPGAPVAALSSEALAVGEQGAVDRYKPGEGWLPEHLFGPGERIEDPNLRAVAWPTANRIYAVGERGEMWLWRGETGLWERDPATPLNFRGNLYGIAFDPANPARGYAVGSQATGPAGLILGYGKTWTEEQLPAEVQNAQFTGIAFAGSEALAAYSVQTNPGESTSNFKGGLLVNDGSGWSVDREEQQVTASARVQAVAALPDGGAAVLAGEGTVRLYERESAGAPWRQAATPLPHGLTGSLALYRRDGALRALVSPGGSAQLTKELAGFEPPPGSPPYEHQTASLGGGASPWAGVLLRQTATGWSDEEHEDDPVQDSNSQYGEYDEPYHPDSLIATLVAPGGEAAWAVGGITGEGNLGTADVARYPSEGRAPNEGESAVPVAPEEGGVTTVALAGGDSCAAPCTERVQTDIGPQVWLESAVALAKRAGASAFFYTGPMVSYSSYSGSQVPRPPFAEEYARYEKVLFAGGPSYAGVSEGELEGESALVPAFAGLAAPLGSAPAAGWAPAGGSLAEHEGADAGSEANGYYALDNAHVVVVVLDDAAGVGVDAAQRAWLEQQLQLAGQSQKPVIVLAEGDLSKPLAPGKHEAQAESLFAALVGQDPGGQDPGGYAASAYFYDAHEKNVSKTLSFGGASLHVIGSGTLGYALQANENTTEFHGAKGFVLGEVQWGQSTAAERAVDRAPVQARLIPVIGELAMEPLGGTFLRRSTPVLFDGLARVPRAGCRGESAEEGCDEGRYVPIPSVCVGVTCSEAILPEYEFRSSRPDIGGFVKLNTATPDPFISPSASVSPADVLLNAKGEPVKDGREEDGEQVGATSGLFCPYNAGETKVTISAGGRSYTLPVQVQAGSVRQPCGTVPLRELPPVNAKVEAPTPTPSPQPAPVAAAPAAAPPPLPLPPAPPAPTPVPPPVHRPATPTPFVPLAIPATPLLAFVPPPVPTPARPTPPTGTSAVTSPVEMAEKEEEREEAPESVSNKAVAYQQAEHEPSPLYGLGCIVLAAFAGASMRRRPRRGRRELRIAPATVNATRAQRRWSGQRRRPPW